MRVLMVSSGLKHEYGGAAVSEASLAAALSRLHDVTVLVRKGRHDPAFSALWKVPSVEEFSPWEVAQAWGNADHWISVRMKDADVFHLNGHWYWENYLFSRLSLKTRTPYVLHPRGMLVLNDRRPFLKRLFNLFIGNEIVRAASRVVALSRYEVAQYTSYFLDMEKIAIVPNGLIAPKNVSTSLASHAKKYFLYLGRISPRKNLSFLIEAFEKFNRARDGYTLLIVGPADKPYAEKLNRAIRQKSLEKKVLLMPAAYEAMKWSYLQGALALIYPAVDEAFGRVPFEAVAMETFAIVPKESGSAEYLAPFTPFTQYEQGNIDSLLHAMNAVASGTENEARELNRARAWVAETLDWQRIAGVMTRLYTEMMLTQSESSSISQPCLVPNTSMTS